MIESEKTRPSILRRGWSVLQWIASVPLLLIALVLVRGSDALSAPEAPVSAYYASVGILALVAVSLSPLIFFRLPKAGKWLAYIAVLPAIMLVGAMLGQAQAAYERTPEGAKEAEARAENEKEEAIAAAREAEVQAAADKEKAETAELLAKAEAEGEKLKQIMEQQDDCLSWQGELKDLNRMVRDSLHNPDSFEHVSTEFIVPTAERHNVLLTFRAENGFGATRAARVAASMIPETCEILEVGEPQPL